jgi:hypothetical protein
MLEKNAVLYGLIIQILASIFLLVVSVLIGFNNFQSVGLAIGLFTCIGIWIFLFEWLLVREIRHAERKVTHDERRAGYNFLTTLLFRDRPATSSQFLTLTEILAMEAQAYEVWIYAYDLKWENDSTQIPDVVSTNLQRGVVYRYIVPLSPQINVRVQGLLAKYSDIPNRDQIIAFRTRAHEQKLVQFGIAIFNPIIMKTAEKRVVDDCVAVFYPPYSPAAQRSPDVDNYLCYRGAATIELQEAFLQLWDNETAAMVIRGAVGP